MQPHFEWALPATTKRAGYRFKWWAVPTLLLLGATTVGADNWPQWRGARFDGISHETGIAAEWGPEQNVAWRLPLPGPAGSTPVVWDNHIFLTTADGDDLALLSVTTDGQQLWRRELGSGNRTVREDEGNYASPSPTTDGLHVCVLIGTGKLACFDFAGNKVWDADLAERYGPLDIQFGLTSSPILHDGHVYVQMIHGDGDPTTKEARVVCLDKRDGSEVWNSPRVTGAKAECEHAYTSPLIYRDDQHEFLLTHGADFAVAYALDDGRELWRCGGLNPHGNYHPTLRFVASPGFGDGLIIVPTAKGGIIVAVRPDGSGDISESDHIAWRFPRNTPDVPSPLVHEGIVYLCRERGNLLCLDAKSGEELYYERIQSGRHRASPLYADGKIYLTSRTGQITVIKPGREYVVLAQNSLEEEMSASPLVANGTLYLRTFDALYAIREGRGG